MLMATLEATLAESALELDSPVEAAVGLRGLQVDDDLVLIDLLNDRSFRLNATGGQIWMLIQERRTVGDVAATLERAYGLKREEAETTAREYLEQLVELGIAATEGESAFRD
jgi:Coenzyme PQQ synthesis protein D (PqqD)